MQKREELRQRRFEEVKREIAIGIDQADQDRLIPAEEVFRKLGEQQARIESADLR
jgi:antitoxin ParD1/3/4